MPADGLENPRGLNEAVHAGEHGVEIASSHRAIEGAEAKNLTFETSMHPGM